MSFNFLDIRVYWQTLTINDRPFEVLYVFEEKYDANILQGQKNQMNYVQNIPKAIIPNQRIIFRGSLKKKIKRDNILCYNFT